MNPGEPDVGQLPHEPDRPEKSVGVAAHRPDLHGEPCFSLRLDNRVRFAERQAHWFFDQDVLSGGERGQHDLAVIGVRVGDEHGV